jgi:hypothetical protein
MVNACLPGRLLLSIRGYATGRISEVQGTLQFVKRKALLKEIRPRMRGRARLAFQLFLALFEPVFFERQARLRLLKFLAKLIALLGSFSHSLMSRLDVGHRLFV